MPFAADFQTLSVSSRDWTCLQQRGSTAFMRHNHCSRLVYKHSNFSTDNTGSDPSCSSTGNPNPDNLLAPFCLSLSLHQFCSVTNQRPEKCWRPPSAGLSVLLALMLLNSWIWQQGIFRTLACLVWLKSQLWKTQGNVFCFFPKYNMILEMQIYYSFACKQTQIFMAIFLKSGVNTSIL